MALMSFALTVAVLQHVQYRLSNKRLEKRERGDAEQDGDAIAGFRYTI